MVTTYLILRHIFSCDQAALRTLLLVRPSIRLLARPSVRLSVCLSVCLSVTPFSQCSHHRIVMKFSGVITNDRCDGHAKNQGQRSKVKVTKVKIRCRRFRTVTPVWIHIRRWIDAHCLIWLRAGALLFFKVICQISRSHRHNKNYRFWSKLSASRL